MKRSCLPKLVLSVASLVLLGGCASDYVKLFEPVESDRSFAPLSPSAQVHVINVGEHDPEAVYPALVPSAALVGRSSFVGPRQSTDDLKPFAKKVGANLVLIQRRFTKIVQEVGTTTVDDTRTSHVSGQRDGKKYSSEKTTRLSHEAPYVHNTAWYEQEALFLHADRPPNRAEVSRVLQAAR